MTRATLAAIVTSGLVLTAVMTYGIVTLTDTPLRVSVIEARTDRSGSSAVTITGREQKIADGTRVNLHGTVHFRTNPAERPNPRIIVITGPTDGELISTAVDNGDVVATLTPSSNPAESAAQRRAVTTLLQDAQHFDTGPFGQIFTNPTMPPVQRITSGTSS